MEKKTVAVVVTYNRKELLLCAVSALLSLEEGPLSVLIADNASTDGTQEAVLPLLRANPGRLFYENTGKNLGGAGGFAYGIRRAVEMGAYYIWIMDDDCIVKKGALGALLSCAEEKGDAFGFLSSAVYWKDGTPAHMNVQRKNLFREVGDLSAETKVKLASFVSLFLTAERVEQAGLPYAEFFIWGDDWEYTARLSALAPSFLVGKSRVEHRSASNLGVDIAGDSPERLSRYFYAYRNEGYFYRTQGLVGRLAFFLKKQYHRLKILRAGGPAKKERLRILAEGAKAAKTFAPTRCFVHRPGKEIRVLEFFGEPLSGGGQEAFMLNMYRAFTDKNIRYTFLTPFYADNKALLAEAEARGDRVIAYGGDFERGNRKTAIRRAIKRILREEKFDAVHIQSGSIFALLTAAREAKKRGVPRVIVHSHAGGNGGLPYRLIKKAGDLCFEKAADIFLACSEVAAVCKFPPRVIKEHRYTVIDNGIDTDAFAFRPEVRESMRAALGLGEKLTLCHVGRFAPQKNHPFLLRCALLLKKRGLSFRLLLVGVGEGEAAARQFCRENGMEEDVLFLGLRPDVPALLAASDIFLLPSLYEGLSISSIEAQCAGLPTLCSDRVTAETGFTDLVSFLPITDPALWADAVTETAGRLAPEKRGEYAALVAAAGYNAAASAARLERIYAGGLPTEKGEKA